MALSTSFSNNFADVISSNVKETCGMAWIDYPDEQNAVVAISNFIPQSSSEVHYLPLTIGDVLEVKKCCEDWYYGNLRTDATKTGAFPKNYVTFKCPGSPDRNSGSSTASVSSSNGPVCSPIVAETSLTLRQWITVAKQLYAVKRQNEILPLIGLMKDLMNWREKVINEKLSSQDMLGLKQKMSKNIDVGNKRLGLDLVVRDENGNVVDSDSFSVIELFEQHCSTAERIRNESRRSQNLLINRRNQGNWCLFSSVSDFLIRTPTDVEIFLALYDAQSHQYISEFFTTYLPFQNDVASNGTTIFRRTSNTNSFPGVKVLYTDFGNKDTERKKVFLICRVVKFGPFDSSSLPRKLSPTNTYVRQTYAVGALDVSEVFSSKNISNESGVEGNAEDQETPTFMPLLVCESKFEETLQKILEGRTYATLTSAQTNNGGTDFREQGVWLSVQRLWGNAEEVHSHALIVPSVPVIVRKIGFPEVITREDVRNDMYLTLVGGDFKESGKDRNIEVKVSLVNDAGDVVPDSFISNGIVVKKEPTFTSTVYQHEHKPKWNDVFKLAIPVDNDKYKELHLRFTFKHRSSNESKDKTEKPFAVSYIKLIQFNGTILMDGDYELNVFKTDKRFDDANVSYLQLPSTKTDLHKSISTSHNHSPTKNVQNGNFALTVKDSFHIHTVVCSTSLTQNVELLGLLEWKSKRDYLKESLEMLIKRENDKIGAEIVKFLQDILNVLFEVLANTNEYDQLTFDALVYVFDLVDEKRFHSFKPVMDDYLQGKFCAVQVYEKLIDIMNKYIRNVENNTNQLYLALKSLEYFMKFVVQSRHLFTKAQKLSGKDEIEDRRRFSDLMSQIFVSLARLLQSTNERSNLKCPLAALKFVPRTVSDVMKVFDAQDLANLLIIILKSVPPGPLVNQKLQYVKQLVNSEIFSRFDCRQRLLPEFLNIVKRSIENNEELELCSMILTDIMKVLYSNGTKCQTESDDLKCIVKLILRPVMQLIIRLPEVKPIKSNETTPLSLLPRYIALLIDILDQLNATSFRDYIRGFTEHVDLMDFIIELFMLLKDLIENLAFSSDWFQMICAQNSVLLKIMGFLATTVRQRFSDPFQFTTYDNFFLTSVAFITQKDLQLETFTRSKREALLKRYRDMRLSCAKEIRNTWFQMNHIKKADFIPSLVGPLLLVTLIPQSDVRQLTIPIFLDMIITGLYYKPKPEDILNGHETKLKFSKFIEFERELISKLDCFVDEGKGDSDYTESFTTIMKKHLLSHKDDHTRQHGGRLTTMVQRLMRRLLEFRDVKLNHNCIDNCMICLYNLLEFYRENEQLELYVRYLYKLYDLHMSCENFVEAASTLKLHANQLKWCDDIVPEDLRSQETFRDADDANLAVVVTQRKLKESLYYQIIALYDRGKLWEKAIKVCKELQEQYERITSEYEKLSSLLVKMARMYKDIMSSQRAEPEYFRVGFYGQGFPAFLQKNQVFIYRGQPYERIADFTSRMTGQFPKATLMSTLAPPSEEQLKSNEQYLQIQKVDTIIADDCKVLSDKNVSSKILWYYKYNRVQKFFSVRRLINRGSFPNVVAMSETEKDVLLWMEQTTLVSNYRFPGILRCFPVTSTETTELSPLQVAINTMKDVVRRLRQAVEECEEVGEKFAHPLILQLSGIINPNVQGGIANYEKTFFTESFESQCNEKQLREIKEIKDLIASLIPLLEKGLFLHAKYCTEEQRIFHSTLVTAFEERKKYVEANYGTKPSLLPPDSSLHFTRPRAMTKLFSVDSVVDGQQQFGTLPKRQLRNDNSVPTFTSIRGIGAGMMGTVPRRTHDKRKPSQQSFSDRDTPTHKRLSNTSIGSSHSSDSVQGLKNGLIMEMGEIITPQRPLRPSSSSTSGGKRTNNNQSSMRGDRQASAVFHTSLGSLLDDNSDDTDGSSMLNTTLNSPAPFVEQPPPLPPRPTAEVSRSVSIRSMSINADSSQRMHFVLPRKDKPLPPVPKTDQNGTNQ